MQAEIISKYKKAGDYITTMVCSGIWIITRWQRNAWMFIHMIPIQVLHLVEQRSEDRERLNDRHWSKNLTEVRSICPHFGIMEQQSGQVDGLQEWKVRHQDLVSLHFGQCRV